MGGVEAHRPHDQWFHDQRFGAIALHGVTNFSVGSRYRGKDELKGSVWMPA